jgi:hypothetical protein
MSLIVKLLLIAFYVLGLLLAQRKKNAFSFSRRSFIILFIVFFAVTLINFANLLQTAMGSFNTSEPFYSQLFRLWSSQIISFVISAGFLSLCLTYALGIVRSHNHGNQSYASYLSGISAGICLAGFSALLCKLMPLNQPFWPDYTPLLAAVPSLSFVISTMSTYLNTVLIMLFFTFSINELYHRAYGTFFVLLGNILLGLAIMQAYATNTITTWLIMGLLIGLLCYFIYTVIIRFDAKNIITGVASFMMLNVLQHAIFNAYRYAWVDAILAVTSIGIVALLLIHALQPQTPE